MIELWKARQLIAFKAWADFRAESERMYLGVVWWVLDPLLRLLVYYLAFGVLLQRGGPNFISVLIVGITPWLLFNKVVLNAAVSIGKSLSLLKRSPFPRAVLPLASILEGVLQAVFSFAAMFALLLAFSVEPTAYWMGFLPLAAVFLLIACGTALPLAAITPFFPDLGKVVTYLLRLLFFLSGVFYRIEDLGASYQPYLRLNPIAVLIESLRNVLLDGEWPPWQPVAVIAGCGLAGSILGLWLISYFGPTYAKRTRF